MSAAVGSSPFVFYGIDYLIGAGATLLVALSLYLAGVCYFWFGAWDC